MSIPKSVLLHLDGSTHTVERIGLARRVAEMFDAEVSCQPCILSALVRYPYDLQAAAVATGTIAVMKDVDRDAHARMRATLVAHAVGSPRLHWSAPRNKGSWGFVQRAHQADLLILGQHDPQDALEGPLPDDFLPYVLMQSRRPALVSPRAGAPGPLGRDVLVAWKETPESARALIAALPWLRSADRVHVTACGADARTSLARLGEGLYAQGVPVESLHDGGASDGDIGARLLSHAAETGADLLVMGCSGHRRARDWVLGDATHAILHAMTLPVLMSH